jgi:hypothetical protein
MKKNKDIKPRNDKGKAHGVWQLHWADSTLMYKCSYNNDKEIGYEEWYSNSHKDGVISKIYHL